MTEIPLKLKWACRRGMLELDILLGNYLQNAYLTGTAEEQRLFEKVLDCNDQELFEWFTGKSKPNDEEIRIMIGKILAHAKAKS